LIDDSKSVCVHKPLAAILLCTFNGAQFLSEHPDSLKVQTNQNWIAIASNDSSSDLILETLKQYKSKIERVMLIWEVRFRNWSTQNIDAFRKVRQLLVKNHQEILRVFELFRGADLKDQFRLMEICGLYRQTRRGTFSLFLAPLFKKI
jgi:hypothetical protein